ncbi:MAG: ribonuclease P protein component [Flavobacteriales bacterium]
MTVYQFNKAEKLCDQNRIDSLFDEGQTLFVYPFKFIWKNSKQTSPSLQTLISVPKKKLSKACHRNKIKRLIRESFRKNKEELESKLKSKEKSVDLVILYTSNQLLDYKEIENKICLTLQRLVSKL